MQNKDSDTEKEILKPRLSNFRQPMVTASGIFLGFMLNFAAGWIGEAFTKYIFKDIILSISTIISIASLMTVLYRILNMDYPTEHAKIYYQNTLKFFIIGISMPFVSFILVIIHRLLTKDM